LFGSAADVTETSVVSPRSRISSRDGYERLPEEAGARLFGHPRIASTPCPQVV